MIEFFVPGVPKSTQTGSVVNVRGRRIPMRMNRGWSETCHHVARQYAPRAPIEGPVNVHLTFWMPKPRSTDRIFPTTKPDLENLSKGLMDAWNGVLWRDDSQVVRLILDKRYAAVATGVGVKVWPVAAMNGGA